MALRSSSVPIAVALLAALLGPGAARAHWCDDLWDSAYNVVVRPASDTVDVPASGTASLDLFVQNNMGYPLKDFKLEAHAAGFAISGSSAPPKVAGYLMPGEKVKYTLAIQRSGGTSLQVESLSFYVSFGDAPQSRFYGLNGPAAVVRKASGELSPPPPIPTLAGNYQSLHLQSSANADYGDLGAGLDALLAEYCAGRSSWDRNSGAPIASRCPSPTSTVCPTSATVAPGSKYDYQHLWAAGELAYRRASLGARLPVLRDRLRCGWVDTQPTFKAFTGFVLGYLGEDAGARSFLEGVVASGTADEKVYAKAALVAMGKPADLAAYGADLRASLTSGGDQARMVAAAALGVAARDDAAVEGQLIPEARWIEPDTSDNGRAMMAAHLLNLVAWSRRGWAPGAGDTGSVSFYAATAEPPPPPPPPPPGGGAAPGGTVSAGCGQGTGGALALLAALAGLLAARRRI